MRRLSLWLQRKTSGWLALAALLLFVAFMTFVLPRQAQDAAQHSGAAGSPDTSLTYSADDLYAWAEAYGADGRRAYIRARFTFDVIWPLVYTFFLVTALSTLTPRAFPPTSLWQRANIVPLLAFLFDLLENSATALTFARYPAPTPVLATLAGPFTALKWLFVGAGFVLLLVSALFSLRTLQRRKT